MGYCVHCGHALDEGQRFCTACGSAAERQSSPAVEGTADSATNLDNNTHTPQAAKKGHSGLLFVLATLFVLAAAGIGGMLYAGYKVKQKAATYLHSQQAEAPVSEDKPTTPGMNPQHRDRDKLASQTDADNATNMLSGLLDKLDAASHQRDNPFDNLKFVAKAEYSSIHCPVPSAGEELHPIADARIPFVPGLKLTTAWGRTPGDEEIINTISEIKPEFYRLTTSGATYINDNDVKGKQETNARDICASDLKNSYGYVTENGAYMPPIAPDTTQALLSAAAFNQLKSTGQFNAKYLMYFQADDHSGVREHWREGTLSRIGNSDLDYLVIVNNEAIKLPTILARGTILVTDRKLQADTENINNRPTPVEIQVLDDPKNPLVLNYSFTNQKFRIQVVKIEYPTNEKKIEQALAKERKAVVYGIYFDFNSDKIRVESKPVMDEIASALKDNPDWKLTVNGYTDNIGGDGYNLDLSRRRSASVRQALVTQYHIAPDRLTTGGYGNSNPIDTNDTLQGRARNRRVELTRQ
jgi:outer membrane protein OmpA-like peptidoglycan-associated protein